MSLLTAKSAKRIHSHDHALSWRRLPPFISHGTWCSVLLLFIDIPPTNTHSRINFDRTSAMVFGKGFRSKMEKMFSSSTRDPEVIDDPPPPYVLPEEFAQAGIEEDDLAILRDYDTVIIVDDSASMDLLWNQVQSPLLALSTELVVDSIIAGFYCRRAGHWRSSRKLPLGTIGTELISISSTTTKLGNVSR